MEPFEKCIRAQNLPCLFSEPLSAHTTFGIGGKADYFLTPQNAGELVRCVGLCREAGMPYLVVGRGSNLLFSDGGFRGAVIATGKMREITVEGNRVTCGAGVPLPVLARSAERAGLSGLEFCAGIPGSVGGGIRMNAGAYGSSLGDYCREVRFYDGDENEIVTRSQEQIGFSYRHTCFTEHPNATVLQAVFEVPLGDPEEIARKTEELLARRRAAQPLEYPSAGSVFKRPEGAFAGKLIEDCGLKGRAIGGAQVSEKHAGFIVNRGNARSADVRALIRLIRKTVLEKTGFSLECEIVRVDESGNILSDE